ncbi:MAG: YdjY domain-containing protein [Planctomycetaceae bacterium]|jgi:hypothetical protein|nr:YdjY domain-containing protein [Planctomycetaceae bacterium]
MNKKSKLFLSSHKNIRHIRRNGSIHIIVPCVIIVFLIILSSIIFFKPSTPTINRHTTTVKITPPSTPINPQTNLTPQQENNNNNINKNTKSETESKTESESETESKSKVDDLTEEELRIIYENQLREEAEKLRKLVEEEERFIPLVANADKLIQLHPKDRIWIDKDAGAVIITGRVVLREGMLELFACKTNSKEHESIVSIRVMPELIHAGLLAIGAESGKPMQMKPKFTPPSGDEIEIKLKWKDKNGEIKEAPAQDWIWDNANSKEDDKKIMKTQWVFTGSVQYKDENGNDHYVANETGELFGLSNFVGSILDVPMQSSADNDKLLFSCFTEKIPPLGTLITIILTATKNKK